ncbi:hypothetical protein LTR78_003226 [Recurvomyces mirabilis]|uniref:Uncharacterized protein n=1 Tax=Recurvomyces mirabilis TaxID=574656 RepID=A0AAE0WS29_9PEZI|nr:hypothetical protein LTR78_003226 [Recurvomyces mirabilis]KAK5156956.1 hypothetical protein LTS14_004473 [Recurvomyces mirabilis]
MSFPSQPAFIYEGGWSDETRKHPASKWLENYTTKVIDTGLQGKSADGIGHTKDWTYQKSTGEVIEGNEKAWKALQETYAPFKEHLHDPKHVAIWETKDGWAMYGVASVYYKLQVPGEGGVKGPHGKEWDGVSPGAFYFDIVKAGGDKLQLRRTNIFNDPSAALVQMLKRGMLKPEQLMG